MINKILKAELFTLFSLTVLSFLAFYYHSVLPDNFFTISSTSSEVNFLSYYLTSFVTLVGFYTGPWVFFPFILFALFYSTKFSKREYIGDSFLALFLFISFMSLSFLFAPNFLGTGLNFLLEKFLGTLSAFLVFTFSFLLFLYGCFRSSFKDSVVDTIVFLKEMPSKLKTHIDKNKPKAIPLVSSTRRSTKISETLKKKKLGVSNFLKGLSNKEQKQIPVLNNDSNNGKRFESNFEQKPLLNEALNKNTEIKNIQKENTVIRKVVPGQLKANIDTESESEYKNILSSIELKKSERIVSNPDDKYFDQITFLIEEKLSEFKIDGEIINILKGPVVDTFELELGAGVKVSKVTNVSQDLSLALFGAPIRIVYPMKGRTTVGIEVPRNPREIIYLDDLLQDQNYINSNHTLPIAMGKDAFGDALIVDLAKMPHMLVAGATGAGKSVFINTLLVSLLLKLSPKQLQLILIDPKQLELALYSNLPHLIMPIITDAKTASIGLLWAVQEMERRYSILKDLGVRNIASFNEKLKIATPAQLAKIHEHYENVEAEEYELAHVVIIIDEFADLILTKAGKEIECNVSRLAAKARAAGIHIILATQRPSTDVITGVIKSNFPTRVSFRVSSYIDSRTILDKMGAECLLGKGDMLYKHGIETMRVHSSYVDEKEIEQLTAQLGPLSPTFDEKIMNFLETGGDVEADAYTYGSHISSVDDKTTDELYKDAMRVVLEQGGASASMLQRRLKIGYNRAANLIDVLESKGVVGPAQGSKSREVLISSDCL